VDTFKASCLPLAVVLLAIAAVIPPVAPQGRPARWPMVRWVLCGVALVLAAIALFITLDTVS
jgi:hypothetical protein